MRVGVFINYRRSDSRHPASRIYDSLCSAFGRRRVFMDIDSIRVGKEFPEALNEALARSGVLVAIVGHDWLTSADSQGQRRLDNPNDFVRQEIAGALQQKITVIPVLLDGTPWFEPADLPDDLKPLLSRNYISVRHETFGKDVSALVQAIREALRPSPEIVRARNIRMVRGATVALVLALAIGFLDVWLSPLKQTGTAVQQAYSDWQERRSEARTASDRARAESERQAAIQENLRLEQLRQDDAAFEAAVRLGEPAGFRIYLEQHPEGRHRDAARSQLAVLDLEARNKADAIAWERAQTINTLAEYNEYSRIWPSGQHAEEVRKIISRLAETSKRWDALKGTKAPGQLRQLSAEATGTEYHVAIDAYLNEVERADKADWVKAETSGTRAAFETYLSDWSEGDYRDDAKARVAEIDKSAEEWNRIKGKNDEAALEAFLRRDHIADFASAALAELVALKRARDKSLPRGISVLPADAMTNLINGRTIRFVRAGTAITFNAARPPESVKLRPSYLQATTKEKFSLEGPFVADIVLDGRRLSIGGIGGVQESRVDKTGSLLLLQILSSDRTEQDIATLDRLYATLQIIKHGQDYVCIGTQWSFMLGKEPQQFSERCQFE